MEIERRFAALEGVEIRANEGEEPRIVGYAAVFNSLSEDLGGFRERIAPGAFTKSLGNDVRALFDHQSWYVLGRTRSKTLTISEDRKGLAVDIAPPNNAQGQFVIEALRRGDIDQMSFGFRVRKNGSKWEQEGDTMVRTLLDVDLFDVSVVTFPAYPDTAVALRSLRDFRTSLTPPDTGLLERMRMRARLAAL